MFKNVFLISLFFAVQATAHSQYEFGLGTGETRPIRGSNSFYNNAQDGNIETYWIGYALDEKNSVQLEYDHYDFDAVNTEHDALMAAGVRRFYTHNPIHPLVKVGLGVVQSKNQADDKKTSFTAKAAAGLELDCKYVSVGVLANYHYINKAGDTDTFKNAQALSPSIFITFHPAYGTKVTETKSTTAETKAVAKDTDLDGVIDANDKCPNTAAGTKVNAYGCAEKEKASIQLNIVFPTGKTVIPDGYNDDITALAEFMKTHTNTQVEIAGHTDNTGNEKTNVKLSQARASAVVAALTQAGVAKNRLTAKGYGSSKPAADNTTAEGRTQNRRVIAEVSAK